MLCACLCELSSDAVCVRPPEYAINMADGTGALGVLVIICNSKITAFHSPAGAEYQSGAADVFPDDLLDGL